jgi:hypothetical protein
LGPGGAVSHRSAGWNTPFELLTLATLLTSALLAGLIAPIGVLVLLTRGVLAALLAAMTLIVLPTLLAALMLLVLILVHLCLLEICRNCPRPEVNQPM